MASISLPLEDPEKDAALRALLEEGALLPLDIDVVLTASGETFLEVSYPKDGYFSTVGITSTMTAEQLKITRAEVNCYSFLYGVDPAVFNLGHLSPVKLPVFTKMHPLTLYVEPRNTAAMLPTLKMTLWGRLLPDPSWANDSRAGTWSLGQCVERIPKPMFEALRLLKRHEIGVEDADLRALLDKCAPLL